MARRALLLLVALGAGVSPSVPAQKAPPATVIAPRTSSLFASGFALLQGNRAVCQVVLNGEVCQPGWWPDGTADFYSFNSGLQLAAVIPAGAGFVWAGDTVGAYIFDPRGTQAHGDGVTPVFDGANPRDPWPVRAIIRDSSVYHASLLGRATISEQDSWVRYWDGNPQFLSGRTHPMGIAIEQRTLQWRRPLGNEDIIYFVFTLYNVTARGGSGVYDNPTIPLELQAEIAALGDSFQDLNEAAFGIVIPDAGYALVDIYAGLGADGDVAIFSQNYATAVLPFHLGVTYAGTFLPEAGWSFPPEVFGQPFATAPGFFATQYLRRELTMFSNHSGSGTGFPDPVGVFQLSRYLSGYLGGPDLPCTVGGTNYAIARLRRVCYLMSAQADARYHQASGPFSLAPGEARTVVMAYLYAAPLAAPLAAHPGGGIGGNNTPGIPYTGDSIFVDPAKVRPIDRVMGWVSESDVDGDQVIEWNEVITTPRSLLHKAQLARVIAANKFLLSQRPAAPDFQLVPGDNRVTIVWQPSATETVQPGGGDPFFPIASDPAGALYDPSFRQYDVEGYRIYRGRDKAESQLIATFDYTGTAIVDYTGGFDYGGQCAPELGITSGCPVAFDTAPPYGPSVDHPLVGTLVQVLPGDRVELASGSALVLRADTVRGLTDNGVPNSFVDMGVLNGFTYHYTVTAFDVNSARSAPASMESVRILKTVTPRGPAAAATGPLDRVHAVPDPYYVTNSIETSVSEKVLRFVNLPQRAIVRIYSSSGILVAVVTHDDPTGGGEARWDLRNRNGRFVASGVYYFHVEEPGGRKRIGRFTIITYAP